ncbi:MAG: hypothetical protein EAZ95_17300 [Bacteroidetes bacterium]|nr:MAG: hypothetical protein EAZ95_17300 [Bacteroidota bacterium]
MLLTFRLCIACWLASLAYLQAQVISTDNLTPKSVENVALARDKEAQGDKRQASYYLNEAANLEWERKNYPSALELYSKSLKLNEQVGNTNGVYGIYNNLGMIYHDMEDYNKALDFFLKNLVGRRAGGDKVSIISSLINISVVLNNLNRHSESIKYLQESLSIAREMGDSQQMRSCYGMLAETYEKMGDSKNMLHYFDLYRSFHEKVQGDREKIHKSEIETARLRSNNLELEKRNKELELERKEFELKKKDATIVTQTQKHLQLLHSLDKNQLIIRYLQKDSILKAKAVELQNLQIKETQEKHNAQRQQSRIIQTALIVGLSLLMLLMGILLLRYREKKKTNKQLARQKEEIDQERQKADTLLYNILPGI